MGSNLAEKCKTCRWHSDLSGACMNSLSYMDGSPTLDDFSCEHWNGCPHICENCAMWYKGICEHEREQPEKKEKEDTCKYWRAERNG